MQELPQGIEVEPGTQGALIDTSSLFCTNHGLLGPKFNLLLRHSRQKRVQKAEDRTCQMAPIFCFLLEIKPKLICGIRYSLTNKLEKKV